MNAVLRRYHDESRARRARFFPPQQAVANSAMHLRSLQVCKYASSHDADLPAPSFYDSHVFAFAAHRMVGRRSLVLRAVVRVSGVSLADLKAPGRCLRSAVPRQVAMYILRYDAGLSLKTIGRVLQRDHTTVMHATRSISLRMGTDYEVADMVRSVREVISRPLDAVSFEGSHFE